MARRGRQYSAQTPQQVRGLGFTLVELTVVLAVIAAILGGMIALSSVMLEDRAYKATVAKMKIIQQALTDYRLAYNTLPCPINSVISVTDPVFGTAPTTIACTGAPAADRSNTTAAIGMLPVRTLGLPDEMGVDGWGRRFRYAVSTPYTWPDSFDAMDSFVGSGAAVNFTLSFTPGNKDNISVKINGVTQAPDDATTGYSVSGTTLTFNTAPALNARIQVISLLLSPANSTTARITVNNNDNNLALTSTAIFVIVSHGKNGHGALPGAIYKTSNMVLATNTIGANSTNSNEFKNCKCDNSGQVDGAVSLSTFVQGDPKPDPADSRNNFDDIVMFATRADLRGPNE